MLLKFGPYSFPLGQVEVLPSMSTERDESGRPIYYTWTINVSGMLLRDPSVSDANGALNLTNYDNALRALTSLIGQPLTLYDNLNRPTSINFPNTASALCPMQVVSMSYPDGGAGQYVTIRSFNQTFIVTYAAEGRVGSLTRYHETVQVSGLGGRLLVWQPAIVGPWAPCEVYEQTPIRITVAGQATGFAAKPRVPNGPLSPVFLINPSSATSNESPKYMGNRFGRYTEFPVSWNYIYEGMLNDLRPQNVVARAWPLGQ